MGIVCVEDRDCLAWPLAQQLPDEPVRVRGAGREVGIHRREQRVSFALETPQHGVHEAGGAHVAELACRVHRLGHRGVRRGLSGQELEEAHLEQALQGSRQLLGRAIRQAPQDRDQPEVPA